MSYLAVDGRDHSWTIRARSDRLDRARAYVRDHTFEVGVPASFDDDYGQISALEYFLGALAAEAVVGLGRLARKRAVDLDHIEALIRGSLENPLVYLKVRGEEGSPRIDRVHMSLLVNTSRPREEVQSLWEELRKSSPLFCTLAPAVELTCEVKVFV